MYSIFNLVGYMAVPASFHLVNCQFYPKHNSSQKTHCYIFPISVQKKEHISDLDFKKSVNSHITGFPLHSYCPEESSFSPFLACFLILRLAVCTFKPISHLVFIICFQKIFYNKLGAKFTLKF